MTMGIVNKNSIPCQAIGATEQQFAGRANVPFSWAQVEYDLRTEIGCPRFKRELTGKFTCPTGGRVM